MFLALGIFTTEGKK